MNYRALPLHTAAALCFCLGPDSRTRQRALGITVPLSSFLLALAVDHLAAIRYGLMGSKEDKPPERISALFTDYETQTNGDGQFADPEDFEKFRAGILAG